MKPINVVVADGSPFVCRLLKSYLEAESDIQVVGVAQQGQELVEMVEAAHPDVVTLGLEMPDMSGLEALKATQHVRQTPAIVISGVNTQATATTLEALQYGAVDFVSKFTPGTAVAPEHLRQEIVDKVRHAARIIPPVAGLTVARTEAGGRFNLDADWNEPELKEVNWQETGLKPLFTDIDAVSTEAADVSIGVVTTPALPPDKIIVIGMAADNFTALQELLGQLPADFSGSILVVQHLSASASGVTVEQLQPHVHIRVKEAEAGEGLQRATALLTPVGMKLQLSAYGCVQLHEVMPSENDASPIDVTLQSVATVYGRQACGVLLAGVDQEGIAGLAAIRRQGGITFVQVLETDANIEAEVVDHIAPPQQIAQMLLADA